MCWTYLGVDGLYGRGRGVIVVHGLFSLCIGIFKSHLVFKQLTWALMQWLKLPAWKVGDRGFKPHYGLQVPKKQYVSSPLTRKDSFLWRAFVTER